MRVVLDTNILARRSFSHSGPAAEIFRLLRARNDVLVTSEFILDELRRILHYPRLIALHGLDEPEIVQYAREVEAASSLVEIVVEDLARVAPHDPDDDPVVATAVAGNADAICTRDRHLRCAEVRDYCAALGIRILTDVELLVELRGSNG